MKTEILSGIKKFGVQNKNLAQHTFVAIAELSGIIFFNSYFRLTENTCLRSPQKPQAQERYSLWLDFGF